MNVGWRFSNHIKFRIPPSLSIVRYQTAWITLKRKINHVSSSIEREMSVGLRNLYIRIGL